MIEGAEGFGRAFASGLAGFLSKPIQGAKENGIEGLAKGFAQGTVGLFVKPMVGLAEGISSASEGLHTVTEQKKVERLRLPRTLGSRGQLLPFDESSAIAQHVLLDLALGSSDSSIRALSHSRYCGHSYYDGPPSLGQHLVITTTSHIIAAALNGASSTSTSISGNMKWYESVASVAAVEATGNAVVLHLRDGGVRFIPCAQSRAREELFRLLNHIVTGV